MDTCLQLLVWRWRPLAGMLPRQDLTMQGRRMAKRTTIGARSAQRLERAVQRTLAAIGRTGQRPGGRVGAWRAGLFGASVVVLLVLIAGAVGLTIAFSQLLVHRYPWQVHDQKQSLADIVKLAFAAIAGLGAAVGLTVAYRRQRDLEASRFTADFGASAAQLGASDAAVRLAGAYAMAAIADEWPTRRQQCIDVLCAYLRLPNSADPGDAQLTTVTTERTVLHDARLDVVVGKDQRIYQHRPNDREVRRSIIRIIRDHLIEHVPVSWCGYDLDFTGAVFDGGDFTGAVFGVPADLVAGRVRFTGVTFAAGMVDFGGAQFTSGSVSFDSAQFSGGSVFFNRAKFAAGNVSFNRAQFTGGYVSFADAQFSGGSGVPFTDGNVSFDSAQFTGGYVSFDGAQFTGGSVSFAGTQFTGGKISFDRAQFTSGIVAFNDAQFTGGNVHFGGTRFDGSTVSLTGALVSDGVVDISGARLSGGALNVDAAGLSAITLTPEQLASGVVTVNGKPYPGSATAREC